MLKQQSSSLDPEDPFLNIFEEGMEEFVKYQKQMSKEYKSRGQKNKEKIEKLQRDLNDAELKKKRNTLRREAEKKKMNQIIQKMSPEELKEFIEGRKRTRIQEKEKVRNAMKTGQTVMIDLVFEGKMNGKENKSLAKQIELIMKGIKHVEKPPSIHLCNFQGGVQHQLEKMGYEFWPLTTHIENIVEVGKKMTKKLVYLSPDAELPLEKIEQDTAYILGGLIDRTIIKNASLNRATSLSIQARKLPIKQYMRSRTVLNLDHVVLMLCKYKECNDWKEAFDYAAPKRWKKDAYEKQEKAQNGELSEKSEQSQTEEQGQSAAESN